MRHGELLEKLEAYKPVAEFHAQHPGTGFKETANKFGISPMVAASRVRFVEAHRNDPQCTILADETHYMVLALGSLVDLSAPEKTRADLVNKFKCNDLQGPINYWPGGMSKSSIKKLFRAFKLNWFELNGYPVVHWSEQP